MTEAVYSNPEHTEVLLGNESIPAVMGNRDFRNLIENNTPIGDYVAPELPPARISKLVFVDRLIAAGLFEAALLALKADPMNYERWQASNTVDPANAEVIGLVAAIGGDLSKLLAPEK